MHTNTHWLETMKAGKGIDLAWLELSRFVGGHIPETTCILQLHTTAHCDPFLSTVNNSQH